jgi:hypothetical protein
MNQDYAAIKSLQCTQNVAMRIITGCNKMTDQDHLLAETQLLPISENLGMVCSQFLANASQESHPSHAIVNMSTGLRKGRKDIVNTLQSRFQEEVQPYLRDGVLPSANYKQAIGKIHTKVVTKNRQRLINKVLNAPPPDISPEKYTLPRRTRTVLGQLK